MELLIVGARLATCVLSNKNEATVIKTRLRWGTRSCPKVPQKYSKSTPEAPQKCSKSTPMEYSIDSFHPVEFTVFQNANCMHKKTVSCY